MRAEANVLSRSTVADRPTRTLSEAEIVVTDVWKKVLRKDQIEPDAVYSDIAGGAKRALQIIQELKLRTGVELPLSIFCDAPTITGMAKALEPGCAKTPSEITKLRGGDATLPPVIIFPGVGGALIEMISLVQTIDYPGEIYGVHATGLDGAAPPDTSIIGLTERTLAAIKTARPSGPYHLVGYSLGACVAIEINRILIARNQPTGFLGLIEPNVAQRYWPVGLQIRDALWRCLRAPAPGLARWLRDFPARSAKSDSETVKKQSVNPEVGRVSPFPRLTSAARRKLTWIYGDTSHPDFAKSSPYYVADLPTNFQQVRDAGLASVCNYKPRRYDGPATYFVSHYGDLLSCLPPEVWPAILPKAEWCRLPGDHAGLLRAPVVNQMGFEISQRLAHANQLARTESFIFKRVD